MDKKDSGYLWSALANMQNASSAMSWANNCVEDVTEVPKELVDEMRQVCSTIQTLYEQVREIRTKG